MVVRDVEDQELDLEQVVRVSIFLEQLLRRQLGKHNDFRDVRTSEMDSKWRLRR